MLSPHTNKNITISKAIAIALLPIAALAVQPAMAEENRITSTIQVAYEDLNLANEKDQKRLSTRVNSAVKKACDMYGTQSLSERLVMQECKAKATKQAYRQLNVALANHKDVTVKMANSRIFIVGN